MDFEIDQLRLVTGSDRHLAVFNIVLGDIILHDVSLSYERDADFVCLRPSIARHSNTRTFTSRRGFIDRVLVRAVAAYYAATGKQLSIRPNEPPAPPDSVGLHRVLGA